VWLASGGYPVYVATKTITDAVRAERERQVEASFHSAAMEGLDVPPAARLDSVRYVAGEIDSEELIRRARARYGLD